MDPGWNFRPESHEPAPVPRWYQPAEQKKGVVGKIIHRRPTAQPGGYRPSRLRYNSTLPNKMIHLHQLTKRFVKNGSPALDSISVEVLPGRITGLVGPDGAGKTTLLRILAGLLEPTQGTVSAFGRDVVRETLSVRRILGYMPQRFGLYEDLSVMENLSLYAELQGVPQSEQEKRFAGLLRFTGLEAFTSRLAKRLSGGMKQKLGLACALVKMPKLLLLDEPGVGVDPISRRELWRMVRELVTEEVIVIWSTAYLDEAELCDDVLLLNEGKMLFWGKPTELTSRLQNRVVQVRGIRGQERRSKLTELLREPDVMDGVLQGSALRLVLKEGASLPTLDSGTLSRVAPRFEDGFIEILGGMPKGESVLARQMRTVPETCDAVVAARNLCKRFGTFTAVHDNNFEIRRGEIFGLLGPNGAGKSTTFKMLCGLLRPTSGEGFIAGHNLLKSASKARSRLGYMAQKFSLYGDLTVKQNLSFFAGTYGLYFKRRHAAVNNMLEMFDMERYAATSAGLLPLGFKQRLSLACALMHEPDVLFLDEPTSGVDPLTRREFWGHINALVEKGVTVLVTTHFMDEAEYCDRISLIYHGETIAEGTPDALKQQVGTEEMPSPTLEDAFIELIRRSEVHR
ncbi:MAG: ATP-binding cassette domain-containing protein [Planctomycetaceae bacterium]|nr:ATP-binding cassette domain-containing protein [Planctomycetaceae bacterium]